VIGPAPAAELICSGDTVNAGRAQDLGIVRAAVPGERLLDEALSLARRARQSGAWREARRHKQEPVGMGAEQQASLFESARARVLAKTRGQLPAPLAALGAIGRGCNLPLEEGLKVETEAFVPLLGSPTSANLITVFFMTQRLQKGPGVADPSVRPKPVNRVGVLGAGIMGAGIAEAHVRRGIPVLLLDNNPAALEKGVAAVTRAMQRRHDAGRMTQADVVASLGRLNTTTVLATMADRDVVIEAVIENEATKTQLYRDLGPILKAEAILASNTSTISLTRMAEAAPRPEDFAGMHFFNPVDRMRLVEVIRGKRSSDETIATLVALAKRIGKTPIVVRDCPGFLVNRILFPYLNESLALLEEGAGPRAIDGAATAFGMPMGPIALQDLIGLDTCLHAGEVLNTAFAERARTTGILRGLVAAGRLGQKSGAGFHRYAKGVRGEDDPAALALVGPFRSGHRGVAQEEMTDRLFLPMLVEASRVLEEGIVREPGDVDMGLILGIGFPSFKGGLLRWADSLGLRTVLEKLRHYEELGPQFRPTERMRQLAAEGKEFYAAGWTERAG
jgi:3-hydroxyacyl-CoA dehydrogenase/enoyl-CoA hydratase/3-hydroxybutyryl-CoA epimerase/3-hydroxyacyl-CoA dehydrogenase/enoyl-CoA hydratase/3-hydroxybutyryl-CoA epimerase/enoyl-CoA isomerase